MRMKMKKTFITLFVVAIIALVSLPNNAWAAAVTPSGIPLSQLEEKIDQIMEKHIGTDVPGAAVSIVKDDEMIFSKGYGYANIDKQVPMSAESTYMEAGSVSKLFTWTAVMQLVEQGKLDLNADIQQYLPDHFLNLAYKEPVTLNHLMNHMGGFEERVESLLVDDPDQLEPLEQYLRPENQPKQIYAPGTVIAYSNYGTNLAGYIVERVSGMPFETYIKKFVFEPLGMEHSTFTQAYQLLPEIMENKATGYSKQEGQWKAMPNKFINDMPAGSLNITSEDMARFMLAHLNSDGTGKYSLFANTETLAEMHEISYTHNPALPGNAHGFWERFAGDYRVLEHGGNTDSFTSLVSIVPAKHFGISILTNVASEMSGARTDLLDLLVGDIDTEPQAGEGFNHSQAVEGKYRSARAVTSSPLKITSAISDTDTQIIANDTGGITLRLPYMGISRDYVETAPYLFERVDAGNTMMDYAGINTSRIYFSTDDHGNATQLSYGTIADELPVSFWETPIFSYILLGTSGILFMLGLVMGVIRWIRGSKGRRNEEKHTSRFGLYKGITLISSLGVLVLGNLLVMVTPLVGNPFQPMANFNVNFVFFWVFGALFILVMYGVIANWKLSENTLFQKIYTVLLALSFVAVSIFLYSYNFYSLY